MDTGFNAAAALRQDGRLMGLLHAGYGLGTATGPIVVGTSLASGGGVLVMAAALAATVLALETGLDAQNDAVDGRLDPCPAQKSDVCSMCGSFH